MRTSRKAPWIVAVLTWIASAVQLAGCYYQAAASYEAQAYTAQAPEPQPAVALAEPFDPGATATIDPGQPVGVASAGEPAAAEPAVAAPPPIASAPVQAPEPAPAPAAAEPAPQPVAGAQADVVSIPVAARPEFYALLGQAQELMSARQYPQALRVLNAARRFSRHPAVLFNMAICLEHMQQFQRAAAVYRRVTIDPLLGPRAQERLGVLAGSRMIIVR